MLSEFRSHQEQRQQVVTRQRRAARIGADEAHEGAGGRIGAAAPSLGVEGRAYTAQPLEVELMQTGSVPPDTPGLAVIPPEIERRSSSLSSDDFAAFSFDVSL